MGLHQVFQVRVISFLDSTYIAKNLQLAVKDPETVSQLPGKELNNGYLIGRTDNPAGQRARYTCINIKEEETAV